jgi:hypothetical protein
VKVLGCPAVKRAVAAPSIGKESPASENRIAVVERTT